ncbi:MAG: hypothetical protein ACOCRN_03595 [Spirochaetia bacterium]
MYFSHFIRAAAASALALTTVVVFAQDHAEFNDSLDYAQVIEVTATEQANGTWRFETTVEHNDEGWDHYADAWQVLVHETGEQLAERELLHPHVDEMPFTRSESGVSIPDDVSEIRVRAKCNVHGFGGREVVVDLNEPEGDRFTVNRR